MCARRRPQTHLDLRATGTHSTAARVSVRNPSRLCPPSKAPPPEQAGGDAGIGFERG
jgi:hypothetical protein